MNISPIQNIQKQNFKGLVQLNSKNITKNKEEKIEHAVYEYDYYPFSDETPEEIRKAIRLYEGTTRYSLPYPRYDFVATERVKVQPALTITKEDYAELKKQGLMDCAVINVFS